MPRSQPRDKSQPSARPASGGPEEVPYERFPFKARLRYEHAEKWVAWAPDEESIIASGDTHDEVRQAAILAGFPRAVMDWVPPVTGAIWG